MRQAARITLEVTPGTYASAALPAARAWPRITGDNATPDRPTPNRYYVRDAAAGNRNVQTDYGTMSSDLKFSTPWYGSQSAVLIPMFCNLAADGLSFKPTSTFTYDLLEQLEDTGRTAVYARWLGCVPESLSLKANNSGDAQKFMADFTAKFTNFSDTITTTDFDTPALSAYPADLPNKFQQLTGGISIGGTPVGSFKSFELTVKNILDADYDESVYPQAVRWCGRDVSFKIDFRWKSQTLRAAMNGVTPQTVVVTLTDGSSTHVFDFKTNTIVTGIDESTPLGSAFYQATTFTPMLDATAGTDFVYTYTP